MFLIIFSYRLSFFDDRNMEVVMLLISRPARETSARWQRSSVSESERCVRILQDGERGEFATCRR
jgi:hypothetical protein